MSFHEFSPIPILEQNSSMSCTIGINFNDSTQPASFSVEFTVKEEEISRNISIKAPVGEIIRSVLLSDATFNANKEKLKGMNEHSTKINYKENKNILSRKVLEAANLAVVASNDNTIRYIYFMSHELIT